MNTKGWFWRHETPAVILHSANSFFVANTNFTKCTFLLSIYYNTLGKDLICRMSDKLHYKLALNKLRFSSSVCCAAQQTKQIAPQRCASLSLSHEFCCKSVGSLCSARELPPRGSACSSG